jgi:hypothetical protein
MAVISIAPHPCPIISSLLITLRPQTIHPTSLLRLSSFMAFNIPRRPAHYHSANPFSLRSYRMISLTLSKSSLFQSSLLLSSFNYFQSALTASFATNHGTLCYSCHRIILTFTFPAIARFFPFKFSISSGHFRYSLTLFTLLFRIFYYSLIA